MMPGLIIPFVCSKQMALISRTSPCEGKLPRAAKPFEDAFDRLFVQIRASNLPGSARSDLSSLEKSGLSQTLDRAVADAA